MQKVLFGLICLVILFSSQNVLSQTEKESQNNNIYSSGSSFEYLKSDYKQVDVVAYVDVKEVVSVDSSDDKTDCVNFTGIGYCSFMLKAEIKELYKGKIKTKTIEFSEYGEAQNIRRKDHFLGEKVVFLEKFTDSGKVYFQVLDNSTRQIEFDILEAMRKIAKGKLNRKN